MEILLITLVGCGIGGALSFLLNKTNINEFLKDKLKIESVRRLNIMHAIVLFSVLLGYELLSEYLGIEKNIKSIILVVIITLIFNINSRIKVIIETKGAM